ATRAEAGEPGIVVACRYTSYRPPNAAGIRIDPPPSVPRWILPMPRTTAATAPPEDPPGVLRVSHGLRVTPVSGLSVTAFHPNSGIVVLPMRIALCSRTRATAGASRVDGASDVSLDPNRAGMPATRMLSLTPTGTPSMRPRGAPAIQRASASRALLRAPSRSTQQ